MWHPEMPSLGLEENLDDAVQFLELFTYIEQGGLVEAHSVFFEFCIWLNIMQKRYGWPGIPLRQWRCSAAKAAAHALPRALDKAGAALKLAMVKDMEGSKAMKKMAKVRKSRKAERLLWAQTGQAPPQYLWHEDLVLLDRVIDYCRQDVLAEEALSSALPDLTPHETDLFLLDLEINARGFQLDTHAVKMARQLLYRESILFNQELTLLTDRKVKKATQRTKMLAWFEEVGLKLYDTQKTTIDETLLTDGDSAFCDLTPTARRGLEIVRALGRASTAKYQAMADWMAPDGRVRGGLLFHGASTGRWAGKGVQPHNFVKGTQKVDQAELWATLKRGIRSEIAEHYRGVMEALSNGLRGAIVATKGHQLYVADYNAIEARVLLWLVDDQKSLDIFRSGRDIYCEMATDIYKRPITKADGQERQLGKATILGCGYQMGGSKFVMTAETYGITIDEDFSKEVVATYRDTHPEVVDEWAAQEAAAKKATETRKTVFCGKVKWLVEGKFLYCQLPSGRRLAYAYPELKELEMPWGGTKLCLTFMGVDSKTHQWKRQKTYGGSLVENIVQAIARDLMADAMLRAGTFGYPVVLTVHDELISEALLGHGSVHEFEQVMAKNPDWAEGCPVVAEGWSGLRYKK